MIKKYVLGLLLICVAFAGWGQEDLRFSLDHYSYKLALENTTGITNVLIAVDLPRNNDNNTLYFDQNGTRINWEDIDQIIRNQILIVDRSIPLKNTVENIFSNFENDLIEYIHPFSMCDDISFRYAQVGVDNAQLPLRYSNTVSVNIHYVQNYINHFYADDFGSSAVLKVYTYNSNSMSKLELSLTIENFPNEDEIISDINTFHGNVYDNQDIQFELLSRALFVYFDDEKDEYEFDLDGYTNLVSHFYNMEDGTSKFAFLSDYFDLSTCFMGDFNERYFESRKYISRLFNNSIEKTFKQTNNSETLPLLAYNKEFSSCLYSDTKLYFYYFYKFLYELDYIPLADDYSEKVSYLGINDVEQYFDISKLFSLNSDQGAELAHSSLMYILLYNNKIDLEELEAYTTVNRNVEKSRSFNYKIEKTREDSVNLSLEINDENITLQFENDFSDTFNTDNEGLPYSPRGLDSPFLYYHKLFRYNDLSNYHFSRIGTDSFGLLLGAISMSSSFSSKFFNVLENKKISENFNYLNNISNFDDENWSSMSPLRTEEGIDWNIDSALLTNIYNSELYLYNFDIERNSIIVPDYNDIQLGDLIVQYGINNTYHRKNSEFTQLINSKEKSDFDPAIGIIVHIDENNVPFVLSVQPSKGKTSIAPLYAINNHEGFAVNKNNYVVRRLLISENENEPVSDNKNNNVWSILSANQIEFDFETVIDFNERFDTNNSGIDRWIPNTGYKLGFNAINFNLSDVTLPDSTLNIELLPPVDPFYNLGDDNDQHNIYRNAGDYFLEFGFMDKNLDGYALEAGGEDFFSGWLVRFEKKPKNAIAPDSQGFNNYYIHYNPIYYAGTELRPQFRLFLENNVDNENGTHILTFKRRDEVFSNFYVSLKDSENPSNHNLLVDEQCGDDFLLRFMLPFYGKSTSVSRDLDKNNLLGVYDHRMLWRANLYINEGAADNDWNNRYPWNSVSNDWNRVYDTRKMLSSFPHYPLHSDVDGLRDHTLANSNLDFGDGTQNILSYNDYIYKSRRGIDFNQNDEDVLSYKYNYKIAEIDNRVPYDYCGSDSPHSFLFKLSSQSIFLDQYYPNNLNDYGDVDITRLGVPKMELNNAESFRNNILDFIIYIENNPNVSLETIIDTYIKVQIGTEQVINNYKLENGEAISVSYVGGGTNQILSSFEHYIFPLNALVSGLSENDAIINLGQVQKDEFLNNFIQIARLIDDWAEEDDINFVHETAPNDISENYIFGSVINSDTLNRTAASGLASDRVYEANFNTLNAQNDYNYIPSDSQRLLAPSQDSLVIDFDITNNGLVKSYQGLVYPYFVSLSMFTKLPVLGLSNNTVLNDPSSGYGMGIECSGFTKYSASYRDNNYNWFLREDNVTTYETYAMLWGDKYINGPHGGYATHAYVNNACAIIDRNAASSRDLMLSKPGDLYYWGQSHAMMIKHVSNIDFSDVDNTGAEEIINLIEMTFDSAGVDTGIVLGNTHSGNGLVLRLLKGE